MPNGRDELIAHYQDSRQALLTAIEGLSDSLLTEPSIDGWSVKDHLAHIALWDEVRAAEVLRLSMGHESLWRMTGEQDALYNALGYDLRRGISLDQARWELDISRQRLLEAIASATAVGLDPTRYGEAGLRSEHEAEHTGWIRRWRGERGI